MEKQVHIEVRDPAQAEIQFLSSAYGMSREEVLGRYLEFHSDVLSTGKEVVILKLDRLFLTEVVAEFISKKRGIN